MKIKLLIILLLVYTNLGAKNLLIYEQSPYLLEHASNPVDWMPWGEKALAKAKKERKKIFLSIGYSACHWCHVMADESFSDKEVAAELNKNYISIKVDKEELPQVDKYFQTIYKKIKGHSGGWPLTMIIDTDMRVYFVGNYIPKYKNRYSKGLLEILPQYAHKKNPLTVMSAKTKVLESAQPLSIQKLKDAFEEEYDGIYTGFGSRAKFPQVSKLFLMLDIAQKTDDYELLSDFYDTLDTMAMSGLYDHLEGGFFRYSHDASWEIPHFEKMLYTQAEMVKLYTRAYLLSKKPLYKEVVEESIAMVEQRFVHNNLYMSASSAQSDGVEGKYFTVGVKELQQALKGNPYGKQLAELLEFDGEGNFAPNRVHLCFFTKKRPHGYDKLRQDLLASRAKKHFPFIDYKINTTFNAMMIEALFKAAKIDPHYAYIAQKNLTALQKAVFFQGDLYHLFIQEKRGAKKGILEDYSAFIAALLAGYEYDKDPRKLAFAHYLIEHAKYQFYDGGIWYISDDILRVVADGDDKYYQSALGTMVANFRKYAKFAKDPEYNHLADITMKQYCKMLQSHLIDAPSLARDYLNN